MSVAARILSLAALIFAAPCLAAGSFTVRQMLDGPGAEVDPGFGYYADRSAESIASEIRANGYKHVHYVVTNDADIRLDLIKAFHKEGLPVWYLTFCHVAYSTGDFPMGWQEWKMALRNSSGNDFTRLCMNNPGYIAFKRSRIADSMKRYPFDGVELVEPFWPDAPGPSSDTYGCLCIHCQTAFLKDHPEEAGIPEFTDSASPRWYKSNPDLYRKWMDSRTKGITRFLSAALDGPGGVRRQRPKVLTMVWSLAQDSPGAVAMLREAQGNDAGEMARSVRPTAVCLQTNWMDWSRRDLPPDYLKQYAPFVAHLRALSPGMEFTMQVDMGSLAPSRQTYAWLKTADATARKLGARGTVNYEYFITKSMYDDAPRLVWARPKTGGVTLVFQKRVDAGRAGDASNYHVTGPAGEVLIVTKARPDGNMIHLSVKGLKPGRRYGVRVDQTVDTPERWLFKGYPQHTVQGVRAAFVALATALR